MKALIVLCLLAAAQASSVLVNEFDNIIEHVNSAGAKWKAGHNFDKFTTISDIKKLLGAWKHPEKFLRRENHLLATLDSEIPEEFDARKQWPYCSSISDIRDQGNCGSCWAVAGAAAFSDRYCIAFNGTFNLPLSEEELLSCCGTLCGEGCSGGYPIQAWRYFTTHGLVTGGDYGSNVGCKPYSIQACEHHTTGKLVPCASLPDASTPKCSAKCTSSSYKVEYSDDKRRTRSFYYLSEDEDEIKKEILQYGPVEAAFDVFSDFPTYKSGVYHHVTGEMMGGHAVRVIGWGVENSTPYWLVTNSWNEDWGDNGLFKILRGSNECGFEEAIVAGISAIDF